VHGLRSSRGDHQESRHNGGLASVFSVRLSRRYAESERLRRLPLPLRSHRPFVAFAGEGKGFFKRSRQ